MNQHGGSSSQRQTRATTGLQPSSAAISMASRWRISCQSRRLGYWPSARSARSGAARSGRGAPAVTSIEQAIRHPVSPSALRALTVLVALRACGGTQHFVPSLGRRAWAMGSCPLWACGQLGHSLSTCRQVPRFRYSGKCSTERVQEHSSPSTWPMYGHSTACYDFLDISYQHPGIP
jgi:hypothetical protein